MSEKAGRLILDDTLAHHTKCSMEGLAYLRDHISTISAESYRPCKLGDRFYWVFSKVLPMKNLMCQRVRLVASYENQLDLDKCPRFYATDRKDWEAKRILTIYLDRWPTETFCRGHQEEPGL